MKKINKLSAFLFLLFSSISAYSQQTTTSPYSRFGLGDFKMQFSTVFNSLGGGGYAINKSDIINPLSPATYSSFKSNSFIFSTGINNEVVDIQSISQNQTTSNVSLSHIVFGFPLTKKIGSSFGIIPFSSIGYSMENRDEINQADMIYNGDR